MKKILIIFAITILVVVVVFGALRLLVGGGEDTWICVDGQWVKHGAPVMPKPEEGCGEEKLIGGDKDEHGCIGSAGYTWCESKQKCLREWEEPCEQEEVFNLLKELEKETQIDFSGIVKTEFVWKIEGEKVGKEQKTEELVTAGKGFDVEKISDEQHRSIEEFFRDNGFEIDVYNVADGTIVRATGYKKSQIACLVIGGASGYKEATGQWTPPEPDIKDVEVKCGMLE